MRHEDNTIERQYEGWRKECIHCGEEYDSTRYDSVFCSAKCRQADRRENIKLQKRRDEMLELVNSICDAHTGENDMIALVKAHKRISGFLRGAGWANGRMDYYNPETDEDFLKEQS